MQEDSSTQQRSGNDQQGTTTAPLKGSEEELLQVFEQIQLNKDFYDAIARTESCAGEAPQTNNNRANADRAAFQAAVNAAKSLLRAQVKDLAEQQGGQEASPAFLQAYALNAVSVFATQAADESYSGEDLEGEEGDYYTSSSVERPHSTSLQGPTQPQGEDSTRNLGSTKRQPQGPLQQSGDGGSEIDKEIAVIERSASAMVLHSPTTRSNATPSTTQNNNRTPTVSGIPSENGNSSSCVDQDLRDTAGMVGVDEDQGTPSRALHRGVGEIREGREAEGGIQQQQQRNEDGDEEAVLLPPQTPGEPSQPGNDEASDDEDDKKDNNDIDEEANEEEDDQHAALVREMSILEAVDADYDTGIDNEDEEDNLGNAEQGELQEEEQEESPASRDEIENQFFSAPTAIGAAAAASVGGNGGLLGQSNIESAFPGGVQVHQDHHQIVHVSFPSAAALAGQHQASPIAVPSVPRRPHAAAGQREKRDPRPSSSGGPSRLSNDPPKRQRKGPGFIVGSAPQDGRGGRGLFDGEQLLRGQSPVVAAAPNNLTAAIGAASSRHVQTSLSPPFSAAAAGPLGKSDGSAISRDSIRGGGNKQAKSGGKLYRKEPEEEVVDDEGRNKKKKGGNQEENDGAPTGARGKKRDAPVVVREGISLSISLETVPAAELGGVQGGRGAWGSSLVCADLTVHEVASQYWPFLKKTTRRLATGKKESTVGCGGGGASKEFVEGGTGSDTMSEGVHRELSFAEKIKVQELTAALETAVLGALSDGSPKPTGGRRLNAKVKSLAVVAAFDELWKEREKRLQEQEKEKEEVVCGGELMKFNV